MGLSSKAINFFNKYNEDEKSRARALFEDLISSAAAEGYGEYRTHLAFMDQVAAMIGNSSSGIIEAASFKLPFSRDTEIGKGLFHFLDPFIGFIKCP